MQNLLVLSIDPQHMFLHVLSNLNSLMLMGLFPLHLCSYLTCFCFLWFKRLQYKRWTLVWMNAHWFHHFPFLYILTYDGWGDKSSLLHCKWTNFSIYFTMLSPPHLLNDHLIKQIGKLKFGIYINGSENDFIEHLYDYGILFWYCNIHRTNGNISIFQPYVSLIVIGNAKQYRNQVGSNILPPSSKIQYERIEQKPTIF